jgi:hypothetical protein
VLYMFVLQLFSSPLWTNDFPTPDSFCLVLSWAGFH